MTLNGVNYRFGESGGIIMTDPKTIKRYMELKGEQPDSDKYGVFFAFGNKQFEQGKERLIRKGYLKEGEKVCSAGMGMYGTRAEIDRYLQFYEERGKKIGAECDPQEVYFYECNNHECGYTWCDDEVVRIIADYFGKEAAHKVERVYGGTATNILVPLTERDRHLGEYDHSLMMLGRLKSDCNGFFNDGDCRYHRPDYLWAGCVRQQIDEMRKLYHHLPDDIKDASPMSKEVIEDYCKRLAAWAEEEFAKPEYDPHPRTKREDFPDEIYLDDSLYYLDDDDKMQKPDHIWFSCDSRRWHFDDRKTHGRAYTSYLGKSGTTLAPVYRLTLHTREQLRIESLCDVSCHYTEEGLNRKLTDFYYE